MNLTASDRAKFGGVFQTECWRRIMPEDVLSPDDKVALVYSQRRKRYEWRRLVWIDTSHNIFTNEGLDHILNVEFHATTQITTWYCVMSETNTSPAAGMTYAVPSFTETTAYDEATRPAYNEAASSSQSITNSANKAAFTMNATKTLYGAALVGGGTAATTKGDTAGGGTLDCYALFAASRGVQDDDVVNLTYQVGSADDGA